MSDSRVDPARIEAIQKAVRAATKPAQRALLALWITACVLSGIVGAIGGFKALFIVFGALAAYFSATFMFTRLRKFTRGANHDA